MLLYNERTFGNKRIRVSPEKDLIWNSSPVGEDVFEKLNGIKISPEKDLIRNSSLVSEDLLEKLNGIKKKSRDELKKELFACRQGSLGKLVALHNPRKGKEIILLENKHGSIIHMEGNRKLLTAGIVVLELIISKVKQD